MLACSRCQLAQAYADITSIDLTRKIQVPTAMERIGTAQDQVWCRAFNRLSVLAYRCFVHGFASQAGRLKLKEYVLASLAISSIARQAQDQPGGFLINYLHS